MSCPVCLCVLVMPKKTPCGHYYCKNCIEYLLERHLGCGLCRSSWPKDMTSNIEVDKDFQEKVKKLFPEYRSVNWYCYREFHKSDEKSFHHFSSNDFNWKGKINDVSLQIFVDTPFDILICYFEKINFRIF